MDQNEDQNSETGAVQCLIVVWPCGNHWHGAIQWKGYQFRAPGRQVTAEDAFLAGKELFDKHTDAEIDNEQHEATVRELINVLQRSETEKTS